MTLVFLDTETTGLDPNRHDIWEIGLIVRDHRDGAYDGEWLWQLQPDLSKADPNGLRIGRYYERERLSWHAALKGWDSVSAVELTTPWWTDEDRANKNRSESASPHQIADRLARILDGATMVGAVPDFDARFLSRFLPSHGEAATWHYHLVDVETLAAGAVRQPPPWGFDDLLATYGLKYDEADRHTALGDARMVRDLYDAVMTGGGPDGRQTPERRDERAKWTKDVAVILRGLTADPYYEAYRKAADFLDADPPTEPLPSLRADGTTQPT